MRVSTVQHFNHDRHARRCKKAMHNSSRKIGDPYNHCNRKKHNQVHLFEHPYAHIVVNKLADGQHLWNVLSLRNGEPVLLRAIFGCLERTAF